MNSENLDASRIPRHIAITMDGNGRWAQQRGKPRSEGHRQAERTVREIVEYCGRIGVDHLTLYAFSTENWRRSEDEVSFLMRLFEIVAKRQIGDLHRKGVRMRVLGRIHELPPTLQEELYQGMALTRENEGLNLNLAINYGGRAEIVDAAQRLAEQVKRGLLAPEEITEEALARELYNPQMPPQQLPALAGCLQRNLGHPDPLARLQPRRPRRRHPLVPAPRAPLRRRPGNGRGRVALEG
jgi:undecaprenyl diphosphate synthase